MRLCSHSYLAPSGQWGLGRFLTQGDALGYNITPRWGSGSLAGATPTNSAQGIGACLSRRPWPGSGLSLDHRFSPHPGPLHRLFRSNPRDGGEHFPPFVHGLGWEADALTLTLSRGERELQISLPNPSLPDGSGLESRYGPNLGRDSPPTRFVGAPTASRGRHRPPPQGWRWFN